MAEHKGHQLEPPPAGNDRAVRHSAYAEIQLAPRAAELRQELTAIVPFASERDLVAISLLAGILARIEKANEYVAEHGITTGRRQPQPILKVLSTWENSAARLCDQLGLTPTSRVRLGLDLTRVKGAELMNHLKSSGGSS